MKSFYIPAGDWPLDYETYSSFFKRLGFQEKTSDADFLVLPGGADLHVRVNRDKAETDAYAFYVSQKKPVIAICRGMQLVCSLNNNELITHIPNISQEIKHTTLSDHWMGQSAWHITSLGFSTNSRHHQGFNQLNESWIVLDKTPDGIIEAAKRENIFGVQWHPERKEMQGTRAEEWYVEELKKTLRM